MPLLESTDPSTKLKSNENKLNFFFRVVFIIICLQLLRQIAQHFKWPTDLMISIYFINIFGFFIWFCSFYPYQYHNINLNIVLLFLFKNSILTSSVAGISVLLLVVFLFLFFFFLFFFFLRKLTKFVSSSDAICLRNYFLTFFIWKNYSHLILLGGHMWLLQRPT